MSVYTHGDFAALINVDGDEISVYQIECQPKSKQTTPEHKELCLSTISFEYRFPILYL